VVAEALVPQVAVLLVQVVQQVQVVLPIQVK
jgi:hypothetical protein